MKIIDTAKLVGKLLDKVSDAFCDAYFQKGERIEKFYVVARHYDDFIAKEHRVVKYKCKHPWAYLDNMTRLGLDTYIEEALAWRPSEKDIFIHYEYVDKYKDGSMSKCSGAYPLSKLEEQGCALSPDDLSEKLQELRDKYLSKDGHEPCAYCDKQRPVESMYSGTIFSPNWRSSGGRSPLRKYCDSTCHVHDQMAHEG